MLMLRWLFLICLLLLCSVVEPQFTKEAIVGRIQYCLEEGKVLSLDRFKIQERDHCFAPLTQGPCKDREWWVQRKPDKVCSGIECMVPVKYITGIGICVTKHCSLPKVFYKGACIDNQIDVCKEKGKSLIVNLKGESVCECGQGWAIDPNGDCALLFTQGNCGDGNLFIKREHAIDVQDLDVPCRNNRPCQQKCANYSFEYFIETLKDEYGCYDDICKVGGRKGFCCPEPGLDGDIILWYINRLHFAEYSRAICIRNPCNAGEILFHDISDPTDNDGDILQVDQDKMICTPAERNVLTCEGEIEIKENGILYCCPNTCLAIFGFADRNRPRCRQRYFYHPRRKRCVRGYG